MHLKFYIQMLLVASVHSVLQCPYPSQWFKILYNINVCLLSILIKLSLEKENAILSFETVKTIVDLKKASQNNM